jgi:hypothetical protein
MDPVPTFRRARRALLRPLLRRPKLTKRRAAVLLALSVLVSGRYFYSMQEPEWPTHQPSYDTTKTGPNAANFYHAAVESYVEGPQTPRTQNAEKTWNGDLSDAKAPRALQKAAMVRNAEAIRWLHEAGTRPYYGNFDGKWLKSNVQATLGASTSSPIPNAARISALARLTAGSCDVLASEGKSLAAVDRALDVAKWGTDLTHDPTLIEPMVGMLIQHIGYKKAGEHLDALTPQEARVALARLESLPQPARFDQIIRHEQMVGLNMLRDVFNLGSASSSLKALDVQTPSLGEGFLIRTLFSAFVMVFPKRELVDNYNSVFNEHARIAAMPYRESVGPATAFQQKVDRGEGVNRVTQIFVQNFHRVRPFYEVRKAQRELLRARLMLRADGKLAHIPLDPFSTGASQPLRYDEMTGKVWSVGANGIDELGKGDDTLETQ